MGIQEYGIQKGRWEECMRKEELRTTSAGRKFLEKVAKENCEIFPEDSYMGKYLREILKTLGEKADPVKAEMEKHTDRQIYDGCIHLMEKMVDYFQEYLEFLGYDLDKLDEDERFAVGISNMEIVRQLFLNHTRNSGGSSTRDLCEKLGVDPYKSVKFEFEENEEA